ncbi:type ISP restriction/modification enzyme [Helicobacter pylori]|uniref:type ISP restriction/modification enzyme n=1 Tax=Helicobacter pylori TaxID=210 RepID=UPI003F912B27
MHGEWRYVMAHKELVDINLIASAGSMGVGYNYPLYQFNNPNYTENFTPEFRSFIDKHYNHSFEPLEILGYIYALLYSPNYRKRYEGFLKIDYPKILFTNNKDLFRVLSLLGIELIGLHVLNQESLNYSFEKLKDATTIGESYYKEERNPIIKKPSHNEPEKRLYINHSAYFVGVSQEIYDYRIGGYCVLDKYLKSHKNESCDFDRVTRIIKVIVRTIEIQKTLGFLTSDLPHLKGNDSKALMQEILQNPPPPPPHLLPMSPLSYRAKPKPSETLILMAHSSAKKQAIITSTAEVGERLSPYSALPNLALICDRGSKVSPISNVFVTNMLCDLHVNGSGSYAFLLYRLA